MLLRDVSFHNSVCKGFSIRTGEDKSTSMLEYSTQIYREFSLQVFSKVYSLLTEYGRVSMLQVSRSGIVWSSII